MPRSGRSRRAELGRVALLALACGLAGCSSEPRRAKNVCLVVVDTLRADRLAAYGGSGRLTPALDRLCEESAVYRRAYTPAPWTRPAVASILTGRYPSGHGVHELRQPLPARATTLAELLKEQHFRTAGCVSNVLVREKWGFAQGFDIYLEDQARGADVRTSEPLTDQALALLEELCAADEPFFLFVHYFDPHWQYRPRAAVAPVGRLDGTEKLGELNRVGGELESEELEYVRRLYDGEVRETDRALGRLIEALDHFGVADETLLIVTSDHGEGFFEHGHFGHVENLYEETMRVPLILRGPGIEPRRFEEPVSLVSLTATVLERLGLPAGASAFQAPALRLDAEESATVFLEVDYVQSRFEVAEETHMRGVVIDRHKLIVNDATGDSELFDLAADPGERANLAGSGRVEEQRLSEALEAFRALAGDEVGGEELSSDQLELLRELGYVGD